MFEEALKKFGLSEREINVYLSLLKLGQSTASNIAKSSGLIRTTVYDILKILIEKGLVSYVIVSGVKYFESADPERILIILDEKKKAIQEIIPELNKIKETIIEKPTAEVYEGKEGIKTIIEDILKAKQDLFGICTMEFYKFLGLYLPGFSIRRAKAKIKSKMIMDKSKETLEFKKSNKKELRETRYVSFLSKYPVVKYIYGGKVAILFSGEQPRGILIHSKETADFEKERFEEFWSIAKP